MAGCITKWVTVILGRTWLVVSSERIRSCAFRGPPSSGTVGQFQMWWILRLIRIPWTYSTPEGLFDLFVLISSWLRFLHWFWKGFPHLLSSSFSSSPLDSKTPNPGRPKHTLFSLPRGLGSSFQIRICFTVFLGAHVKTIDLRFYLIWLDSFQLQKV